MPKLQLTAEMRQNDTQLKITWANHSAAPFLIAIGSLVGWAGLTTNLQMSAKGTGLAGGQLINIADPGGTAGRMEPLVVCLPPGAEYALNFATDKLALPGYKQTLRDIRSRPWTLIARYTGIKPTSFSVIREYPADFPFWIGTRQAQINHTRKP